jgi:hypothetical protein
MQQVHISVVQASMSPVIYMRSVAVYVCHFVATAQFYKQATAITLRYVILLGPQQHMFMRHRWIHLAASYRMPTTARRYATYDWSVSVTFLLHDDLTASCVRSHPFFSPITDSYRLVYDNHTTLWYAFPIIRIYTDMRRLTTGICSEKCVVVRTSQSVLTQT